MGAGDFLNKLLSIFIAVLMIFMSLTTAVASDDFTYKQGDVDFSGEVDIMDATYVQMFLANNIRLSKNQQALGDVDADGIVSVLDATYIQRYVARLVDVMPDRDVKNLEAIAEQIDEISNDKTLTFSVFADMHYDKDDPISKFKNKNIQNISTLSALTDIDFVANLGDMVIGNVDKATTLESLDTLLKITDDAVFCPLLNVRGNHDDNGWYSQGGFGGSYKEDEIINDKEWCDLALSAADENFVIDKNNPNGGYGYIDHEDSKIRIFVLNSCDIPYILESDGTYRYSSYTGHAFSDAQLDFVAHSLMFADKDCPSEWAALFLTHVPVDSSNIDGERFGGLSALIRGHDYMLSIISAYRKGTAFKKSGSTYNVSYKNDRKEDFMVSVDVDYSEKGYGEVIGFFSGHTHSDNFTNQAGTQNSLSYGYTFIGTSGAEGFNTFVVDREKKTISAFKSGVINPEKTVGNIVTQPHTGTIESGKWSVVYDQFLLNGESIFAGYSEIYSAYNSFDAELTTKIDKVTLEVDGASQVKSARKLTKAVAVKPLTTYVVPSGFSGECLTFNTAGAKRSYIGVTDHGTYKTFTTSDRTGYVVFSVDTGLYKDYQNFYVKEFEYCLI